MKRHNKFLREKFMFKTQRIKLSIGALLLALTAFGAACSTGTTTAQTPRVKVASSPTPEYKPPKRVSRDVIKNETKEEPVKVKETKN
jgi:ABC-type glycerol-3-phosphate transport system substrate-binding protein